VGNPGSLAGNHGPFGKKYFTIPNVLWFYRTHMTGPARAEPGPVVSSARRRTARMGVSRRVIVLIGVSKGVRRCRR
jgi:hypothetical protein